MKYLKCVKQGMSERETNFKIGVIYKLNQNGREYTITCTDTNLGKGKPYTYRGNDDFEEWIKPWYEFEEVTREDYILQEFVNGRIAIQFEDQEACSYWNKILLIKVNNPIEYSMTTTKVNSNFRYYMDIKDNKLRFDSGYDELKTVILSVPEEHKKENKNMKKEFTKSDLKNGMIVRFRNPLIKDSLHILLNGQFLNNDGYNYQTFDNSWKEDLYCYDCEDYDIMEVFDTKSESFKDIFKAENLELIWKREEKEDLTEKEYKFDALTISPNGDSYLEDECDEIFIKKEDMWNDEDERLNISLEEAKFMIESLTEIIKTIEEHS